MKFRYIFSWGLSVFLWQTTPLHAQTAANPADNPELKVSSVPLDLSVPVSPAFTVLGVTPENVIRPASPRAFAASLLNAVDQNGNLQNGLALDAAPFLFGTNLSDYRKNDLSRFLANLQISVATTKGQAAQDQASRISTGLHMVLLNRGDPRLDGSLLDKLRAAYAKQAPTPVTDPEHFDQAIAEEVRGIFDSFRKEAERKPIWILAGAPSWISSTGNAENLKWNGFGVWSSFGFGLDKAAKHQLIFHARYRGEERIGDLTAADGYRIQNSLLLGARFRTGSDNFKYSFEAGYSGTTPKGNKMDHWTQFALILEPRIFEDFWLHLAFTGQGGRREGNDIGFRTALKWSFDGKQIGK